MKLEIKLPDPKYCNGCPYLNHQFCEYFSTILFLEKSKKLKGIPVKRPQKCVEENGE